MISTKRRREGSIATTPALSISNGSRTSSMARSSPIRLSQQRKHPQQQPNKRVSLHSRSRPLSSEDPSTQPSALRLPSRLRRNGLAHVDFGSEHEADTSNREENDSLDEIIMAVDLKDRGTVGCCYYVAREEKLYAVEDIKYGGLGVINTLRIHIEPTVVILSTRVDETVEDYFDPDSVFRGSGVGDANQFALPYILEFRPSPEFGYESGKNKLINLRLFADGGPEVTFVTPGSNDSYEEYGDGNEIGYTGRQGKLLRLSTWIDMESRLSVGCAGALLTYIGRRKAVEYLPGGEEISTAFRISTIEMFSLRAMMFVNADTLASLQILQSESSPNTHSQGPTRMSSGSKEGLSVYGLFHHLARTPQGRSLLRQYFIRPSLDLDIIKERLDTIGVFLRPENESALRSVVKSLGQIKNMRTVMVHLRKGICNGLSKGGGIRSGIWSSLRTFAFHTLQIRDAMKEVADAGRLAIWIKVMDSFDTHGIASVGTIISEVVDFAASAEMHRTVVNTGVDDELDALKRTYDGIEDLLNQTSQDIAATIPAVYSLNLNVIFFPQIGFLISIPLNQTTGRGDYEGGDEEGRGWAKIFSTGTRIYYKDYRMQELDESFGDMYAVICDKEIELVHELGQKILAQEKMLNLASDICGELDSLLALAQGARLYKFCRPRMTNKNVIRIKGGRHPLQELSVPSYVANDIFLVGGPGPNKSDQEPDGHSESIQGNTQRTDDDGGDEGPSMLMMTGPNYSGKSVYLKQVALIVYMAHVGCFVPAEQATIGLTDKILTRITTRETVSRFQSAFMLDLQQVALAMALASNRTLVIIDEFGKGTDSSDGAGLACGVFEYFLHLGDNRPKVLGATHYHEIFENDFLKPRPSLAFGYMEVRLDRGEENPGDQITYLYNFRYGRSITSYGSYCAALNGVDAAVVARADELVELSAKGEDLVAVCANISNQEEEDLKDAEETAREFLLRDFQDLAAQDTDVDKPHEPRALLVKLLDVNQNDP